MAGRVVVFLDYQNVYMGAREAPWDTDLKPALEFVRDLNGDHTLAARWQLGPRRIAIRDD
jgi:hypothetical protein